MSKVITDLWYQPKGDDEIIVMVQTPSGNEYSIADIEWEEHETFPQKEIYKECLQVAHDMGYKLEGEE